MFTAGVLNVLPMTASEIDAAVVGPARAAGVAVEPELVAEIVADTVDQPGSLPLLQYALAEQFDRTAGSTPQPDDYRSLGGVRTALTRRAEQLYESLGADQQQVATQVLLRMVRVGRGVRDVSRRVPISELAQLDVDPVALSNVLEKFIRYRLLSVGSDPVTSERRSAWPTRRCSTSGIDSPIRSSSTAWLCSDTTDCVRRPLRGRTPAETPTISSRGHGWTRLGHRILQSRSAISEREFVEASVAHHQADVEAEGVRTEARRRLELGLDGDSSALPRQSSS